MKSSKLYFLAILLLMLACNKGADKEQQDENSNIAESTSDNSQPALTERSDALPLEKITLPAGFKIEVFAEADNARSLVLSPSGIV
jgi:hypothetical protein